MYLLDSYESLYMSKATFDIPLNFLHMFINGPSSYQLSCR